MQKSEPNQIPDIDSKLKECLHIDHCIAETDTADTPEHKTSRYLNC